MKNEMRISKVKLVDGGNKGLEVTHQKTEVKGGIAYKNDLLEKPRGVVNMKMRNRFKDLVPYFCDLMSTSEDVVEVTGIYSERDSFMLIGIVNVLETKRASLVSPLIHLSNDYEKYWEVSTIVDDIYSMTAEYMKGDHVENNKNIIEYYEGKKEGFDKSKLDGMSEKELHSYAIKLLEKAGCVVMDPNEADAPEEDRSSEGEVIDNIGGGDERDKMFVEDHPFTDVEVDEPFVEYEDDASDVRIEKMRAMMDSLDAEEDNE